MPLCNSVLTSVTSARHKPPAVLFVLCNADADADGAVNKKAFAGSNSAWNLLNLLAVVKYIWLAAKRV